VKPKLEVIAVLKLPDSREFTCTSYTYQEYVDSIEWYWTEGNYGCDCNRALIINDQHRLDLPIECGNEIELVSLRVDTQKNL